ncbi:MAG TPA: SpvB/TcaC N-terminal domain-containing protein [Thermoanaerobaculia bacterium]|nr:SpvB/TcaC N-terminal domain-containing protein [Thermoanaerobaculia bacterium]
MSSRDQAAAPKDGEQRPAAPSISLPKGGGAIRGMGEKFAANPVTGTGSMSVPIATSPGRSGFGPQLSLSYDSGAGNGPFGFGWSLSLPSITRKTDKGLPQYDDAGESDVFILSGSEDLVPLLGADLTRHRDDTTVPGYTIERYRPRIEGLFARIERWTRQSDGDVHWRSISRDNVLTLYGKDLDSRFADPEAPERIFSWLLCETRDDKGNAVVYHYKREDGAGADFARACERNRGDPVDRRRTANRYLKSIRYGNRQPLLNSAGRRPRFLADLPAEQLQNAGWMLEVVFDYGEHDANTPEPGDAAPWSYRDDPFSSYRSGFEVRTTRLCQRVLMFHHIPDLASGEKGYEGLVRSTDFTYSHEQEPLSTRNPVYTFLRAVTQNGYRRTASGYEKRSLPPVEFEYTEPVVQDQVEDVDPASLENLPAGAGGASWQWTDLHGEGIPGILTEQAGTWYYKRNVSPISKRSVELAPVERVALTPNLALAGGQAQFMDLAGDGQPDLVVFDGPMPGLYEHDGGEGWQPWRPFTSRLERDTRDANLKLIDLDGDGHADVLITEDDAFVWHPSVAEKGFGPARRVSQAIDEEKGPRLVFADGEQSVYLADLCGDGLTDLVRIRNGEVCYWPNLGYGRFGAKVSMDHAPLFDHFDQFDQSRIRLADIDGSGTTDILYLHRDGVRLYFNQSGNGWSEPRVLNVFPRVDDLVSITTADLLGNGTACLVWSSPLPDDARRPMRYVNLMGAHKPHLLVRTVNNLGAETVVHYAPSTKFYLRDKYDGRPWITRLPFPVHVVERVVTFDRISRNRFVTRYAYHHGFFDGEEREFRGFGMVEQFDTEELGALTGDGTLAATNIDPASHVPPVQTKSWFHTGIYLGREHVSDFFARDEYYRDPEALLLPDTVLPSDLTLDEEREACRALKGSMLRQEVYALDGSPKERHPYTIAEQNFTVRREQARGGNRHSVFFTHAREAITCHYERSFIVDPADPEPDPDRKRKLFDPRVTHALTLEVDRFGNVRKEASVGYGRKRSGLALPADRDRQTTTLITYTENRVTEAIENIALFPDDYRTPLPCETRTFELTGYVPTGTAGRFQSGDFAVGAGDAEIEYETAATSGRQRRVIEHVRTLYRRDDLTALLLLAGIEPLALPGESYKKSFTAGLAREVYVDPGKLTATELDDVLSGVGRYVHSEGDAHWWIPSGRVFLSPGSADTAEEELEFARRHFFLPQRTRDPFHTAAVSTESFVTYDAYDLLMVETRDALDNRVTVGERLAAGAVDPAKPRNDYRVLQPVMVTDPNRNRTQVAFDILGMVVGTAVLGKAGAGEGDSLDGFNADLEETVALEHLAVPLTDPHLILGNATARMVYDLFAYHRTRALPEPQPSVVYTLARETHPADLEDNQSTKVQHSFSYSDGFGREIQKKIQAEPGPLVKDGLVVRPRWEGSGWTIFNNKGKPVRQYEPFFSPTHRFEFGAQSGVSPILFYDPVERVVATLHPNDTYEKVLFDPWRQDTWDVNDTVLGDPRTDDDIRGFTACYFASLSASPATPAWQTWHAQRQHAALGVHEELAATKAAAHAGTPAAAHLDTLGRPFLTFADNGPDPAQPDRHLLFATRVELDIEGNQRAVRDAIEQAGDERGRIVMRYTYDLLGNRIHQLSMEAGARWLLNDVAGKPILAWDSRGHRFRTQYDPLRRPLRIFVTGADPESPDREILTERLVYGEQHPDAESRNLRGTLHLHLDQAGAATAEAHDFKGNPLRASRRLTNGTQYRAAVDWRAIDADPVALPAAATAPLDAAALEAALAPRLEADAYTSSTTYDALNRPVTLTTPHTPGMPPSVIRPGYNEANLLEKVKASLRGAAVATPFVNNIDYDAKGQRTRIDYGNGASTFYEYDPLTFRLVHLLTRRDEVAFPDDCPRPPPTGSPGCQVQNLHYTYDPAGNITRIQDDAQQTIFFKNQRVEPSNAYTYDALYRLIDATGREHLGQIGGTPIPHSHDDARRTGRQPDDGRAMGTYIERYLYDAVGNFQSMRHIGSAPENPGWTRTYAYDEPSLIEDGLNGALLKTSNRLSSTTIGGDELEVERYVHDAHGSMTRMPHLGVAHPDPNMHWDHHDQLHQADLGGGGTAYYVYDASGQRVRKVWEKPANLTEERIYLGGFEIFRRRQGAQRLERETLHVMDDKQRVALVETRTIDTAGDDLVPEQLIRYQFGNHLGSASLELDDEAQLISYEEYTPYGSTSYQAVRNQVETCKRNRYTGKERDAETSLYYHGARYYIPWLTRWVSVDPLVADTPQVSSYLYASANPIRYADPTGRQPEITAAQNELIREIEVWGLEVETFAAQNDFTEVRTRHVAADQRLEERAEWVAKEKNLRPTSRWVQNSDSVKGLRKEVEQLAAILTRRQDYIQRGAALEHRLAYSGLEYNPLPRADNWKLVFGKKIDAGLEALQPIRTSVGTPPRTGGGGISGGGGRRSSALGRVSAGGAVVAESRLARYGGAAVKGAKIAGRVFAAVHVVSTGYKVGEQLFEGDYTGAVVEGAVGIFDFFLFGLASSTRERTEKGIEAWNSSPELREYVDDAFESFVGMDDLDAMYRELDRQALERRRR